MDLNFYIANMRYMICVKMSTRPILNTRLILKILLSQYSTPDKYLNFYLPILDTRFVINYLPGTSLVNIESLRF